MSARSRVLVRILGLLSLGLAACQSEPDFATLQPQYFGALSVFDDAARLGQPAVSARRVTCRAPTCPIRSTVFHADRGSLIAGRLLTRSRKTESQNPAGHLDSRAPAMG